jgi:hypothetical protein
MPSNSRWFAIVELLDRWRTDWQFCRAPPDQRDFWFFWGKRGGNQKPRCKQSWNPTFRKARNVGHPACGCGTHPSQSTREGGGTHFLFLGIGKNTYGKAVTPAPPCPLTSMHAVSKKWEELKAQVGQYIFDHVDLLSNLLLHVACGDGRQGSIVRHLISIFHDLVDFRL